MMYQPTDCRTFTISTNLQCRCGGKTARGRGGTSIFRRGPTRTFPFFVRYAIFTGTSNIIQPTIALLSVVDVREFEQRFRTEIIEQGLTSRARGSVSNRDFVGCFSERLPVNEPHDEDFRCFEQLCRLPNFVCLRNTGTNACRHYRLCEHKNQACGTAF
jgi:hypothetical protein